MDATPIVFLDSIDSNKYYVKRDDLIPFSFGGNKARKARLFFKKQIQEITTVQLPTVHTAQIIAESLQMSAVEEE